VANQLDGLQSVGGSQTTFIYTRHDITCAGDYSFLLNDVDATYGFAVFGRNGEFTVPSRGGITRAVATDGSLCPASKGAKFREIHFIREPCVCDHGNPHPCYSCVP